MMHLPCHSLGGVARMATAPRWLDAREGGALLPTSTCTGAGSKLQETMTTTTYNHNCITVGDDGERALAKGGTVLRDSHQTMTAAVRGVPDTSAQRAQRQHVASGCVACARARKPTVNHCGRGPYRSGNVCVPGYLLTPPRRGDFDLSGKETRREERP